MGNRLYLEPMIFATPSATDKKSYGFLAHDDYFSGYACWWDELPTEDSAFFLKLLEEERDNDSLVEAINSALFGGKEGLYINDTWYMTEDLLPIIRVYNKQNQRSPWREE